MAVRPATVSKPLNIYQIKLDRAALDRLPTDTRRTVLLFGHVANEINTLNRLLIFSMRKQEDPIMALFGEARAATIARLLIGTTREGYIAVERHILKGKFGKTYLGYLEKEGQDQLANVKKHLSNMKLMAALRNGFAFHFPDHDQIDQAYARLSADLDLSIYSGTPRHSSCYLMSSLMVTRGMLDCVEPPKPDQAPALSDEAAMGRIVDDTLAKSADLNDFIESLLMTIVEREGLSPAAADKVLTVDTHESMKTFAIPPLLRS